MASDCTCKPLPEPVDENCPTHGDEEIEQRFRNLDHSDPREVAELSALLTGGEVVPHFTHPGRWHVRIDGHRTVPILAEDQLHRLVAAVRVQLGAAWEFGPLDNGQWCIEWWEGGRRHVTDCAKPHGALGLAWWRSKNAD